MSSTLGPALARWRAKETSLPRLGQRLALCLALLVLLVGTARRLVPPPQPRPGRALAVLVGGVALSVAAGWGAALFTSLPLGVAPVALAGLLGSLALTRRAGVVAAAATTALLGASGALAGDLLWALGAGAITAAALVWPRRTATLVPAALAGALVQGILIAATSPNASQGAPTLGLPLPVAGAVGVLAAGTLALLLGPLALRLAGRASAWRIRRLMAASHPLMVELRRRAPGTFRHSVRVAQLAETSAQALGADAPLCRLAGCYHDIGKLLGPRWFAENRLESSVSVSAADGKGESDPLAPRARDLDAKDTDARDSDAKDTDARDTDARDLDARDSDARDTNARDSNARDPLADLSPSEAARRIRRHVPDGLRLAHHYRLPAEVHDLIAEHHGSTPVRSLAPAGPRAATPARAEAQHKGQLGHGAPPTWVRYTGPLPRSRESAIVLVADAVEAATRSVTRPGLGSLSEAVEEVVDTLVGEVQFEECSLSQADLLRLEEAMVGTLRRLYRRQPSAPGPHRDASNGEPREP